METETMHNPYFLSPGKKRLVLGIIFYFFRKEKISNNHYTLVISETIMNFFFEIYQFWQ